MREIHHLENYRGKKRKDRPINPSFLLDLRVKRKTREVGKDPGPGEAELFRLTKWGCFDI